MSYRTHIALDLCNSGPRPPTEYLSGSLVRSLPRTLKRDAPLFIPLPCMHARKSNHGGQPRRTLGPTRTSSTRVRVLSVAGSDTITADAPPPAPPAAAGSPSPPAGFHDSTSASRRSSPRCRYPCEVPPPWSPPPLAHDLALPTASSGERSNVSKPAELASLRKVHLAVAKHRKTPL